GPETGFPVAASQNRTLPSRAATASTEPLVKATDGATGGSWLTHSRCIRRPVRGSATSTLLPMIPMASSLPSADQATCPGVLGTPNAAAVCQVVPEKTCTRCAC